MTDISLVPTCPRQTMRLLDAKRLELVDVRDDEIPPYAILSHTWGDEEITLQELHHMKSRMPQPLDKRKRNIVDKKGFVKVKDAAALAVKRGFSYIWVDTCCIDKTSSAELSEAINSMYLWYQQSEECYAFLSDVKPIKEENWVRPNSSLRQSRWFARGWTLQELIAPKHVHFYARDWSLLGHKNGPIAFKGIVSELTGIDGEVLDGRIDPLQLSIAARMKWASHRETTRLEDTAYSLMGLFQVNMPLLYGEGHRAFTRLQEEIIQRDDDQSLYAWNSFGDDEEDPDALYGLLARSPQQFKASGDIQPLPPSPVYASAPSGMTNHGLRVQIFLRPILEADGVSMEEDYYAILDCFVQVGDLYQCPVICLRRLSQDQYARLETKSRMLLPPTVEYPQYSGDVGYRTIYVRQQPVYYQLPQFRMSPAHMHHDLDDKTHQDYKLAGIYPPRQWNSTTMTMKVKYSRKLQAMGVFRFQSPNSHDKKVDVVVGLRRLDAMQWEGWCFQRKCGADPLETTLTSINKRVSDLARTKKSLITSGMLRDSLGDDSHLLTDATVKGMQLQGRLYISISMSVKPEIETLEIKPISLSQSRFIPTSSSRIIVPSLRYFQIRTLTEPCARRYATSIPSYHSLYDNGLTDPLAVRGRLSLFSSQVAYEGTGNENDWNSYYLMKPLHDFVDRVQDQLSSTDPPEALEELALALFSGNIPDVERILSTDIGLDAHTGDVYGLKLLHWAVVGGFDGSIHALLEKQVDPLSTTSNGWNAMHVAAIFNEPAWKAITHHITDEQLGKLAEGRTKDYLETPLHLAAAYGSSKIGQSFFGDLLRDINSHSSAFARNKSDETPFHRAAACNNVDILRTIVTAHSYSKLYYLDYVDRYGRTALWHAAATGALEAVKYLLSCQASINLTDDQNRSPLHAACREGHDAVITCLFEEGARLSTETCTLSLTPLDYAAMFGHASCLKVLLNFNHRHAMLVSSFASNTARNNALHIAASCGWLKCVKVLCESGADPSITYDRCLKLDHDIRFAITMENAGDATFVAKAQGYDEIEKYLKLFNRGTPFERRYQNDNPPSTTEGYGYRGQDNYYPAPSTEEPHSHNDRISTEYPQSAPLSHYPPRSYVPQYSTNYPGPPAPAHSQSSASNCYTAPTNTYGESPVPRRSAPTLLSLEGFPRLGSHSATLPAYNSPAYQSRIRDSMIHNSLQSLSTRTRVDSVQGSRQSLEYNYSTTQPRLHSSTGNPLTYSYGTPQPTHSRPFSFVPRPPAESMLPYPALPAPRLPTPYHPQPRRPASSMPSYHSQSILNSDGIQANLVRMLGAIGNSSMLFSDPPTDFRMCRHDSVANKIVYQVPDETATPDRYTGELPVPVHELPAGDKSGLWAETGMAVLPEITEFFGSMGIGVGDSNEMFLPAETVDISSPLVSSIQNPGSWDRLR